MTLKKTKITVGVISGRLDWSFRQSGSNANFRLKTANRYIRAHIEENIALMNRAAEQGAEIIVGPEYFAGSEMFMTTPENMRKFTGRPGKSIAIDALQTLAGKHHVWPACSLNLRHGGEIAQTGVIVHPDGKTVDFQVKNTAVPENSPLRTGYRRFRIAGVETGLFTCSDFDTYPEDFIDLAKQGMQLVLVPGCGFNGRHWLATLTVRSTDLSCPILYADDGHAAIVNHDGTVMAMTEAGGQVLVADVDILEKEPVTRLKSRLDKWK